MMDIFFFVKTFILTIAIVLVMQIQVGDRSLETHAMSWVQSATGGPLGEVARGAARVAHDFSHKVTDAIHDHVNKNKKEDSRIKRESSFHWLHQFKEKKSND